MSWLIALDVDGTLLDDHHQLASATRLAIQDARRHGANICLATGKLLASVRGLVVELELDGPQITCNGAALMDAATGDARAAWPLDATIRERAIAALRDAAPGLAIAWYTTDSIYTDAPTGSLDRILQAYHQPALRHVSNLDASLPPARKLLVTGNPPLLENLRQRLADQLGSEATVMRTTADFVEVVGPDVNKGAALRALARAAGIPRDDIVAIGDGENDIALLDAAGLGIAVANAMPALLPHASATTSSASDLGVANALTALGLTTIGDPSRFHRR